MIEVNQSKLAIYFKLLRVPFFTASVVPILVGTAIAYSTSNVFNPVLFVLALFAMIMFQAGANISNDYFDHLSRNDWLNENSTPFSGGSRVIQKNLLSPAEVLRYAFFIFTLGTIVGIVIVIMTKSLFVLALGIAGLLGAYFYTAGPIKLGYRTAGEFTIAILFGIFPVYGAYYIQSATIDLLPLLPSIIVAILIFQIIQANEFPDYEADKAANKKTIVVTYGIQKASLIYKALLILLVLVTVGYGFGIENKVAGGILVLVTTALSGLCLRFANSETLCKKGVFDLSRATVLLHLITGLVLTGVCLTNKW